MKELLEPAIIKLKSLPVQKDIRKTKDILSNIQKSIFDLENQINVVNIISTLNY